MTHFSKFEKRVNLCDNIFRMRFSWAYLLLTAWKLLQCVPHMLAQFLEIRSLSGSRRKFFRRACELKFSIFVPDYGFLASWDTSVRPDKQFFECFPEARCIKLLFRHKNSGVGNIWQKFNFAGFQIWRCEISKMSIFCELQLVDIQNVRDN